ncbi:hypothetical protein KHS38_14070 [Mucilaginibacter sp. Bleaf8]|uniref:HNH endonuclease domain-containing protein n=1 Tax=Mucilaginibacter sp. Bleaf8 TaxID=2834430 RepID=UPI001BCFFDA3|nr:HNH endonuclease domain-containing protein [Mucilaginibacter sp. Bleaf8]MBS7565535.1 hypothetical protein [Mucilaginibacter sp. Bleaf8]
MDAQTFININKILERDSKSTTYKFALLRGTIDLIEDNSPYLYFKENRANLPMGLLIEKWLLYYYPIVESEVLIPQINGSANLVFGAKLKQLTKYYKGIGGFSAFYNDLKSKGIPRPITEAFLDLVVNLNRTITTMPMKYLGRSISQNFYSIYQYENAGSRKKAESIDTEYLIKSFGYFSIPLEYYEAFKLLGSFIIGQDAILFKWAEFSVAASGKILSVNHVINEVLKSPITAREIAASKTFYKELLQSEGTVYCVWSGNKISQYDIDHIIPFSIWKNNDLWNLLPAQAKLNNQKRDKIPAESLIDKRKDLITYYWHLLHKAKEKRFQKELRIALLGQNEQDGWPNVALDKLKDSCRYLISTRGFEEWII